MKHVRLPEKANPACTVSETTQSMIAEKPRMLGSPAPTGRSDQAGMTTANADAQAMRRAGKEEQRNKSMYTEEGRGRAKVVKPSHNMSRLADAPRRGGTVEQSQQGPSRRRAMRS